MENIVVGRYRPPTDEERAGWPAGTVAVSDYWQGWIEPENLGWIMFVARDGKPVVFLDRDPVTGGVLAG